MSNIKCQTCKKPLELTRPNDVLDPKWRGRQQVEYHGIGDCVAHLAERVAMLEARANPTEFIQPVEPTVVITNDRQGLYIDDKLQLQRSYYDDMADFEFLMDRLGLNFKLITLKRPGNLPDKLSEL